MSKIDLSKAKIGDKFRTKLGYIVIFTGLSKYGRKYKYMFDRVDDIYCGCVCDINGVPLNNKEIYTIVEQVFDKPLDELIEEGTKQIKENDDAIAEENKLQRRHEVLKYADMVFFNKNWEQEYINAIETAEYIVNLRNQYLKDGKLC
jgi:hypothetical protein